MRIVKLSAKLAIVRHWGKWYRVQRGFTDWHRVEVKSRGIKSDGSPTIDEISDNLQKEIKKGKK